jgi:hypothetical protein
MASIFKNYKDLAILDTYHESLQRFSCVSHEEEILDEFLSDNLRKNYLIHVHGKVNLYTKNNIDFVCFGTRNQFAWRTSLISHFFMPKWNILPKVRNKKAVCTHPRQCTKFKTNSKFRFELLLVLIDALHKWISCFIQKNNPPKFQVLSYSSPLQTKLDLGNAISQLIAGENQPIEFHLTRYRNDIDDQSRQHDSTYGLKFLALTINIFTLPILFVFNLKRAIEKIRSIK